MTDDRVERRIRHGVGVANGQVPLRSVDGDVVFGEHADAAPGGGDLASRLGSYETRLDERFGPRARARWLPDRAAGALGLALLGMPGLARRLVLDRWFLHRSSRRDVAAAQ